MRVIANLQRSHRACRGSFTSRTTRRSARTAATMVMRYMTGSASARERYLTSFASAQRTKHFRYMFLVFFPLSAPGANRRAFDAKAHGLVPVLVRLMETY